MPLALRSLCADLENALRAKSVSPRPHLLVRGERETDFFLPFVLCPLQIGHYFSYPPSPRPSPRGKGARSSRETGVDEPAKLDFHKVRAV